MKRARKCSNISMKKYQNKPVFGCRSGTVNLKVTIGFNSSEKEPEWALTWNRRCREGSSSYHKCSGKCMLRLCKIVQLALLIILLFRVVSRHLGSGRTAARVAALDTNFAICKLTAISHSVTGCLKQHNNTIKEHLRMGDINLLYIIPTRCKARKKLPKTVVVNPTQLKII